MTIDAKRIKVTGVTARQWTGLVKVTGTSDTMTALPQAYEQDLGFEGVRWALRHQITEAFAPWFARQIVVQIGKRLDDAGVTWSQCPNVKEAVAEDIDLSPDNLMFQNIYQPGLGPFPALAALMTFSGYP